MKKKVYYIVYSVIQLLMGVYTCIFSKDIATRQIAQMDSLLESVPVEMKNSFFSLLSVESLASSVRLMSVIGIILAGIFFVIVIRDKVATRKGLCIGLLIASMFVLNDFILILAAISLILVGNTKREVVMKEKTKKKIIKLPNIKFTKKDYFLAILLGLIYFSQFSFSYLFKNIKVNYLVVDVVFYIVTFILAIIVFRKRLCRDFSDLKDKFGSYVVFVLKHWGIMYLIILFVGFIRIALGVNLETANQSLLSNFSWWYLLPTTIIWAPVVEELVFRGILRRFIKNDRIFIVVTALIFGLLHTITSEVGIFNIIVQGLPYIAMGGMLGYVYVKTNNVYSNIMLHFFQNALSVLLMILL